MRAFLGGVQAGFDYQFAPNWVIGAEAQYSWLTGGNNNGVLFPGGTLVTTSNNNQLGSVTGRLGYTWGPTLLYAKGGYAWRDNPNIGVSASVACRRPLRPTEATRMAIPSAPVSNTCSRRTGRQRPSTSITISAKPPSPADLPPIVGARFRDDEHTVKVGINYRFGWGGPTAPALLKRLGGSTATGKAGLAPAFLFSRRGLVSRLRVSEK